MNARRMVAGALYVAATVAVAAVAAWPIHASSSYLVAVAAAVAVGAAIATVATVRGWGGWAVTGLLAAAFTLLAVPLAVPSRLGGGLEIVQGLGEAFSGALFGWKDLLTVDLPVGSYRNLLVPALLVFLVGTAVTLRLAWREDRWANAAIVAGLGTVSFGLFFGRTAVSAPLALGGFSLAAPVETAVGVCGLGAALGWLAWRSRDERVAALHRAANASGVRVSRRPSRADRRRTALGAGMVVFALVAAVAVVPWAAGGVHRQVLRAATGPEREIAAAVSPLSTYRQLFSDARAEEVLFTVAGEGPLPERVRLATLDAYDGEIFRAGGEDVRFVRVPSTRDAGEGAQIGIDVEIGALEGIWMPTAGGLAGVEFEGERAAALSDGFYYSAPAAAGVQTAGGGLAAGDAYRLRGVEPAAARLADISAPGGDLGGVAPPANLAAWVREHATGSDGAALEGLVGLLRERGFLSHALTVAEGERPGWMMALPDYSFQPSASGHSLARIDALFARLLERESDPRAAASGNYVAAIGDDEQFSVAVALLARELGFPSRVVVGTRLSASDPALRTCEAGACRARDVAAWTEVLSGDGVWVAVDVSPQWTQSPSLDVTEQRDPENVTEVRPDSVEEVAPPEPVQEDSARDEPVRDDPVDLGWLWSALRVGGIVLLVLAVVLGPFLAVVAAKAARRGGRRRADDPVERIAGGWEEYVDAGVDAGRAAPRELTRSELAASYGTPSGVPLAQAADRAVFASETTTPDEAAEFWRIVDEDRGMLARERGLWHRIVAAVSLRSFVRLIAPRSSRARSPRTGERGRRRPQAVRRTAS